MNRLRERENELLRQRQEFLYENKKRGEELRQVDEQFEAFVKVTITFLLLVKRMFNLSALLVTLIDGASHSNKSRITRE
jgi:hypothetical protein